MLEELLEHGTHGDDVPKDLEIAILFFVCLFYFLSFLELLHLPFRCKDKEESYYKNDAEKEKEEKREKKWQWSHGTNSFFQIGLNLSFFTLRMIMWIKHKRDAAIFLAKNLISIVINVVPYLIGCGCVDDKNDDDDNGDDGDNDDGDNGDDGDGDNGAGASGSGDVNQ